MKMMEDNMYLEEIRLSRELMRAIEQELSMYGQVIPYSVNQAYLRLREHYEKEMQEGVM
jgi:hypothetical protein